MKTIAKISEGKFAVADKVIDLTEATLPTDHPIMICDPESSQFSSVLHDMVNATDPSSHYLFKSTSNIKIEKLSIFDCPVIYKEGELHVQTSIHPITRNCLYSGKHESGYHEDGFVTLSIEDAEKRIMIAENKKLIPESFSEITKDEFENALECLPPQKWLRHNGGSIFRMCEYYTSNITTHFVEHKNRFFKALRRTTTPYSEIIEQIERNHF